MMQKVMLLAVCALAALGLMAGPALAGGEGYTPLDVVATPNPDGTVTLTGSNCAPNETVTYVVRRGSANNSGRTPIIDQGSGTAGADGSFVLTTNQLPNGRHNITVTCGDQTQVLTASINRGQGSAAAGTGSNLASTGSNSSIPMARLGIVLVATGGLAVYAAKKRRGHQAAFAST